MHILQTFLFWTSNFDDTWVIYLKRKLCVVANECSFEIGRISVIRACEIKRVRPNIYGGPCSTLKLTIHSFHHASTGISYRVQTMDLRDRYQYTMGIDQIDFDCDKNAFSLKMLKWDDRLYWKKILSTYYKKWDLIDKLISFSAEIT